ncbi:MAG: FtsX-like permease family protein [Candidatus Aenigmatarchaeota archaeon]
MSTLRTVSFLAIKDLRRDKKIALLVIFLLGFSFINITFFSAFINGLGNTFQDEIINTATSHIIILPSENTNLKFIPGISTIRKKVELNPDVVATSVHVTVPITISFRNKQMSTQAIAMKPSDESAVTTVPTFIIDGSFLSDGNNNEIVLGKFISGQKIEDTIGQQTFGQLAAGLGVGVGEVVTVTYPNGVRKEYRLRGVLGSNGFSQVSQSAYITLDEADTVFGLSDQASNMLVKLVNRDRADAVKTFILSQGVKNVDVKTWAEASGFVSAIKSAFSIVISITSIMGVMIVVVTIGIVIFINTARKKRIIGVLKALGMSSNQVMMIYVMQSFILGLVGTVVGITMFTGLSYFLTANPVHLPIGSLTPTLSTDAVINAALLIVIASIVAGYIPARIASRQKILETIKIVE